MLPTERLRCQQTTLRGRRCLVVHGLVHCAYYAVWLCPPHHVERLERWPSREEHRAADAEAEVSPPLLPR